MTNPIRSMRGVSRTRASSVHALHAELHADGGAASRAVGRCCAPLAGLADGP